MFLLEVSSGARAVKSFIIPSFPMTLSYALEGGVSVGSTAAAEIVIFLRMEGAKCAKSAKLCTSAVSIQTAFPGSPGTDHSQEFSELFCQYFVFILVDCKKKYMIWTKC